MLRNKNTYIHTNYIIKKIYLKSVLFDAISENRLILIAAIKSDVRIRSDGGRCRSFVLFLFQCLYHIDHLLRFVFTFLFLWWCLKYYILSLPYFLFSTDSCLCLHRPIFFFFFILLNAFNVFLVLSCLILPYVCSFSFFSVLSLSLFLAPSACRSPTPHTFCGA